MDNAAKSIIMVGGVIIGTMVVSIMVYLFSVFGAFSGEMSQKMNAKKYLQFNNNYYQYQGRIDITAQEIKSIINFTKEHNDNTGIKPNEDGFIQVCIDGTDVFDGSGNVKENYKNDFLNGANSNFDLYCCEAKINQIYSDLNHLPEGYNLTDSEKSNYDYLITYSAINHGIPEIEISDNTTMVKKIYFFKISNNQYNLKNKEKCIITDK